MVTILEGREIFIMSADEAKRKGLHPSHTLDPNMIQSRTPKKSMCQARSKGPFAKYMKKLKEGMAAVHPHAVDDVIEESSDEDATRYHKTPLFSHSTTSACLDLKANNPPPIASFSFPPYSPTLTDIKPEKCIDSLLASSM